MPSTLQSRISPGDRLTYVSPQVAQTAPYDGHPLNDAPTAGAIASRPQSHARLDFSAMDPSTLRTVCWERRSDVLEYPIDRDALLFHPGLRLLCQLNETAYFLWQHCDGLCVAELAAKLTDAYQVEFDKAVHHAMHFVELFSISGFIGEEARHVVPT